MTRATWVNEKRSVTGAWTYFWASDRFHIVLDQRDRVTGQLKEFWIYGDAPEWGNWRREGGK